MGRKSLLPFTTKNYLLGTRKKFDIEAGMRAEHTDVFRDIDPANKLLVKINEPTTISNFFLACAFTYKLKDYK